MITFDTIWSRIEAHAGEKFVQIRGGEFTYAVAGGHIILDRTNQQIPKSHFEEASNLLPLKNTVPVQHLRGPSYIYAILMDERIRGQNMLPRVVDFQNELLNIFSSAHEIGACCIGLRSGDLHKRIGGYPGRSHRMPACCQVMKRNMKSGDLILQQPPSGMGANLIICYKLPR